MTRSGKIFLALYGLLLCLLAPLRPLWLDELIQLADTYHHSLAETVERVAHNPGGVPLAYLAENIFVNLGGRPFFAAHLFSILCAVLGLAALIWLLKLLGAPGGWLPAVLLFAAVPISLRYAVEARQYGPALAFSICASALLLWLDQRASWYRAALYGCALALGIYAQPYVAFVAAGHLLWVFGRESAKYVVAGCLFGALLFLPWYLYARGFWVQAVAEAGYQASLNWKTPLMILRELSGGGYLLSLALLGLAIAGYRRAGMAPAGKRLLLLWIIVPLPLVFAGDAIFHYFFAIRQLLFVVPPLCVLAAEGLGALPKRWRIGLAGALAVLVCGYDVRWFTHYTEDWRAPAVAAKKLVGADSCVLAIPASAAGLYRLYEPALPFCEQGGSESASLVLVSPYATRADRESMSKAGFGSGVEMGGSTLFSAKLKP